MVMWNPGEDGPEDVKGVVVMPGPTSSKFPLSQGIYHAGIVIMVDGEPWVTSKRFIVGEKPEDLNWVEGSKVNGLKHIKPGDEWS